MFQINWKQETGQRLNTVLKFFAK